MENNNQTAKSKLKAVKVSVSKWVGILTIFASGACENYLDIEPLESVSDELAIVDEPSLNTALRGAYRSLGSSGYYGGNYVQLGFVPSGNVEYQVFNNIQDLNFLPEDGTFQSSWSAIYQTINIANHIITKAPEITDVNLSPLERSTILGEAHFIRALAYFDLARGFGGVPIKLTPTTDLRDESYIQRSTLSETYAQVLSDLETAASQLPGNVNRIRANKNSVRALRARYHLYNGEWEQALKYSTDVISESSSYNLVTPFSLWFRSGVTQTEESIFEIAFSPQNTNGLRTPMALQNKGGEYRFRPTDGVVKTLKKFSSGGTRLALLDSAVQSGVTRYAGALYYRSPATDPSYILRISEQYLIRAEAKAQLGDLSGAIEDLNLIRKRSSLQNTTALSQEEILDAILEERRFEFLWEAHRYFDLTRTNKLAEEIETLKPNLTITPKLNLFPIPSNEVILGGLTQNPGY